ncbi:ABC transporter substrate-binding protein [Microbacterium forte]
MNATTRRGVALLASGATILALTACTPATSSSADDSFTLAVPATFTSFDPAYAGDLASRVVHTFLYDKLLGEDPETGEAVSNLATSWTVTPTSAHFEIADGITCSDGSAFTAETVVRNLERMQDPEKPSPLVGSSFGGLGYTASVGENGTSVDIEFGSPVAFAERKIAEAPSMVCDAGLDDPAALETEAFGTGPYTLKKASTGSNYELEIRDEYDWGIDGASLNDEMPATVTVRMLDSPDTIINLVNSGEADAAYLSDGGDASRITGDLSTVTPSAAVSALFFNHRAGTPTADVALRQAISELVDREEFSQVVSQGAGTVADSLTSSGARCSASGEIELPSGGADAATDTLLAAGYTQSDSGAWSKDGAPVAIRLINGGGEVVGAEWIQSLLSDFGFDTVLDTQTGNDAVAALLAGTTWDVALSGYAAATPPLSLVSGAASPEGRNFSAIDNADYNVAVQTALTTGDGADCGLWQESEEIFFEGSELSPLMLTEATIASPTWDLGAGTSTFFLIPTSISAR